MRMATVSWSETSRCACLLPIFAYFPGRLALAVQQLTHGHERARRSDLHEVLAGFTTGIRSEGGVQRVAVGEVDLGEQGVGRRRAARPATDRRDLRALDAGPTLDDGDVNL